MFAVLGHDAACRQQPEQSSHRFSNNRSPVGASIPSPRYNEYFACALGLLHPEPALGTPDRFGSGRQRFAKIQRSRPSEPKLVERVLKRSANHDRSAYR